MPYPSAPITLRTSAAQSARLDLSSLDPAVQQLFSASLANSTKKSYQSGVNRYICFRSLFGITSYPTSVRSLSYFVGYLFQEGLLASTVKCYLSAVCHAQISLGLGDPKIGDVPQIESHIKGLRKLSSGRQQSQLPISSVTSVRRGRSFLFTLMVQCCGQRAVCVSCNLLSRLIRLMTGLSTCQWAMYAWITQQTLNTLRYV